MVRCKQGKKPTIQETEPFKSAKSEFESDGCSELSIQHLTKWNACLIVYSIFSYLVDIFFTVAIIYFHYKNGLYWFCGLTAAFLIVPSLTVSTFSALWYVQDLKNYPFIKPSSLQWTFRTIAVVLQMAPVLRYIDCLYYGLKIRKSTGNNQLYYSRRVDYEENDAALLLLFQSLIGNAAQIVLQFYILLTVSPHPSREFWLNLVDHDIAAELQLLFILKSLLSLAWSQAYYHRSLRFTQPEKKKMSLIGSLIQVLYHFLLIVFRVLGVGLLACVSPIALSICCFLHWLLMTGWIISMETDFFKSRFQELLYNIAFGVVYIFAYVNLIETPSRFRYFLYFLCIFLENTCILVVWYHNCHQPLMWFRPVAIVIHFTTFFVGILLLVLYYLFLHPNGRSPVLNGKLCWKQDERRESDAGETTSVTKGNKDNIGANSPI